MKKDASESRGFRPLLPWLIPAVALLAWAVAGRVGLIPAYLFPPPEDVGRAAIRYLFGTPGEAPYAGRFLQDAGASLVRVACGFSLAVAVGIPLGVLSGRLETVENLLFILALPAGRAACRRVIGGMACIAFDRW
jgi:NitT/TauT family transport system permease protein